MRHFFMYWKARVVDAELAEEKKLGHGFDHNAGGNLWKVEPDDTLWVATIRKGHLVLVGRLIVGERVTYETARRRLKGRNLYPSKYHVLPRAGSVQPIREIESSNLASDLRFKSKVNDRLAVNDGKVSAMQLQAMRELTPESARLLRKTWEDRDPA